MLLLGSFAYFGTLLETVSKAISLQDYAHAVIVIFPQCFSAFFFGTGTETGAGVWEEIGYTSRDGRDGLARWSIAITTHLMGPIGCNLFSANFCCCFSYFFLLRFHFFFSFFLHKTRLICFTCHTKLELSWVFKKRSAPASPASSTSCPASEWVCLCGDHPDRRYLPPRLPHVPRSGCWKLSIALSLSLSAQRSVLHALQVKFRCCKLEKCWMKINKS